MTARQRDPFVTRILARAFREASEIKQQDLARALDRDRSGVSHMMHGRQVVPADELDIFCDYLGTEALEAIAERLGMRMTPNCYVLETGERLLSQRTIVAALTGSGSELGAKRGHLDRYTAALPAKYAALSSDPSIEFVTTAGPVAKGRTAEWFVDMLRAYDEADDEGLLHAKQRHLAKQARAILRALAGVGLEALIDEATGFQHIRASNALQRIFNTLLLDSPMKWERMWPADVIASLVKTFTRKEYDGRGVPAWMCGVFGEIYNVVLGQELHAEVKRRNPRAPDRKKHHQFFGDDLRQLTANDLQIVKLISEQSAHKGEFWARLNRHYRGLPIQLALDAPSATPGDARRAHVAVQGA